MSTNLGVVSNKVFINVMIVDLADVANSLDENVFLLVLLAHVQMLTILSKSNSRSCILTWYFVIVWLCVFWVLASMINLFVVISLDDSWSFITAGVDAIVSNLCLVT
jgi:hypothetical protein